MKRTRQSTETLRGEVQAVLSKLTPREMAALKARFGLNLAAVGSLADSIPGGLPDGDDDREDEIQSLLEKLVAAKAKKKPQ
jgi:hypothetical protein